MKFLIVSHVIHSKFNNKYFGYGPYIKEMNLWLKHVDSVEIIAPIKQANPDKIDSAYKHSNIIFTSVPAFNLIGYTNKIKTLFLIPFIFYKILISMKNSDHIHLRCPGNMGLLGSIAQIFFPKKIKTVKYAGNWDPDSIQPTTYVWQKKILSNTFLSKNIKVLVYGDWPNQSSNIVSFFTATYMESEKENINEKDITKTIKLLFVGALSVGKQPIIAVETLKALIDDNIDARLDILGEGQEREKLENYIKKYKLNDYIKLHGNQNSDYVKNMYKESHFLILMSKSEGWPKVVAEAMFWGSVPISSRVSCVEYMVCYGKRGKVVTERSKEVAEEIKKIIFNNEFTNLSSNAQQWSREYTLEKMENSIKGLLRE